MRNQTIYLIGSLRNEVVPKLGVLLREQGHEVFDDWYSAGPEADEKWQAYEQNRGRSYKEAIYGHHATNTFDFDLRHIKRCDAGVLVLPAGKSAHLELGFMLGQGQRGYVLFQEEPERFDIMYRFAHGVYFDQDELIEELGRTQYE